MTAVHRTPGQSTMLPGAVSVGGMIVTSGIVAPAALAAMSGGPAVPVGDQIAAALNALLEVLRAAGSDPDHVLRVEAFLASSDDFAAWNERFLAVWPAPGPARTTLVVGFTNPAILFELQAIASVA